jgi:hypothetical protein
MSAQKTVLCVYDIPNSLKIANPSYYLRKYGQRLNLSCWLFPAGNVPTDLLAELRVKGVNIHLLTFDESQWDAVVAIVRAETSKYARALFNMVVDRTAKIREALDNVPADSEYSLPEYRKLQYKRWKAIVNRGRRELVNAEQAAVGFNILQEVSEVTASLKHLLTSELDAVMAFKAKFIDEQPAPVVTSTVTEPVTVTAPEALLYGLLSRPVDVFAPLTTSSVVI